MRQKFVEYLLDPINSKKFELNSFEEKNGHTISGILFNDKNWYPIINGIPRILIGKLKADLLQSHYNFYKKFEKKLSKKISIDWQAEIDKINDLDKFLNHQKKPLKVSLMNGITSTKKMILKKTIFFILSVQILKKKISVEK